MVIMKKVYGADDDKYALFLLENNVDKSEKNKSKDRARTRGK